MTCYIFGASDAVTSCILPKERDMVIAADGGLRHAEHIGVTPQMIIGDFDSLGYLPQGAEVISLPEEKDETDMAAAVAVGRARGYSRFVIYGGMGGRPDHTMANYQLLADIASRGEEGFLLGEGYGVTALCNGSSLIFDAQAEGVFSVFALGGEARGVGIRGGKYLLEHATLSPFVPLGVSNAHTGVGTEISVSEGTLLVMWECATDALPVFK